MNITKEQYNTALKNGCGEMTVGQVVYVNFGTYGVSLNYPKKTKDGILLLSKHINNWKSKTLKEINDEFKRQRWE